MNFRKLVKVVAPVVTVTYPVEAPAGTVASRYVVPVSVTAAASSCLDEG
jgi:hypothetical protein